MCLNQFGAFRVKGNAVGYFGIRCSNHLKVLTGQASLLACLCAASTVSRAMWLMPQAEQVVLRMLCFLCDVKAAVSCRPCIHFSLHRSP